MREAQARERERADTFWAILHRQGFHREQGDQSPSLTTVSFPPVEEVDPRHGFPLPFPALVRIIQPVPGRITDLLNGIKDLHIHTRKRFMPV
jgi:hypothetical protein